jgi:outer membrane protein OmpA-like peptidoglycan-associated protein
MINKPKVRKIIMNSLFPLRPLQHPGCKKTTVAGIPYRYFILLMACLYSFISNGQRAKGTLQLAEEYFAAGEYFTAANFYKQYLHPPKNQKPISDFPLNAKGRRTVPVNGNASKADILYKQAESYRLANYLQEAANTYKECISTDSVKYADALYWQAVCERSLGNYLVSEEMLKKYLNLSTGNLQFKPDAAKELETLKYIQQQLKRPDSILYTVYKLNVPGREDRGLFAPVRVSSNEYLVSSTLHDTSLAVGVNPNQSHLFYATLMNGNLIEMTPLVLPLSKPGINQGAASLSADGAHMYFTEWNKENGQVVSTIYFTSKQSDGWSSPVLLSSVNVNGYNSKQPFCTSDGKYLFFSSDRPGGSGKFDIWYAPLNADGTTGTPLNAGSVINSGGDDQTPFYHHASHTLVFSSNGRQGMGGFDLYESKGYEMNWTKPENMGNPVNSSRDDIYFYSSQDESLLQNAVFSSDRGNSCCLETYTISKIPKNRILKGIVNDCKDNSPLAGAEVTIKDAAGNSLHTITGIDGKFEFDLKKEDFETPTFEINRETYKDTLCAARIESTDASDYLVDIITNTAICMEKKPEPKLVIKAEDVVTVFFDFDRSVLKPAAIQKLDSIYNVMLEYPAATLQISGYTDGLGSIEYNNILSDKRARACADYLIAQGVDTSRITFESFGACCPVEMEIINGRDNAEGRSRNRRALINVKKD